MQMKNKFNAQSLKKEFAALSKLDDFTLIPLINGIANGFIETLQKQPEQYGISNIKEIHSSYHGCGMWSYQNCKYVLAIDGKLVSMDLSLRDIDVDDEDEFWEMTETIGFDSEDARGNKALQAIQKFAAEQGLEKLMESAAQALQKGKTYHLTRDMRDFYLRGKSK